ncbi:hypothetical protein [Billgrantia antri]|uniref:Uncharacterized protein n=1 Tax=Billgrantia antri TaxID=2846777 RepID=A0ABS6ZS11_9GAMM|nr:hypothetical protein [Halomonas antri]MBW6392603.1 hypothetical protein [Halomonas antri]
MTDPEKAAFGEIRNADGKMFFGMNGKEGIVHLKKAGSLGGPLLAYLREDGVGQQDVTYDLGTIGVCAYAVLVAVVGFFIPAKTICLFCFLSF